MAANIKIQRAEPQTLTVDTGLLPATDLERNVDKSVELRRVKTEALIIVNRLGVTLLLLKQEMFRMMAKVGDEGVGALSEGYVSVLYDRTEFWAMADLQDSRPIGGMSAHVLPMTRSESRKLFIYDLAVKPTHQRRGVGWLPVDTLCREAAVAGGTHHHLLVRAAGTRTSRKPMTTLTADGRARQCCSASVSFHSRPQKTALSLR
jgi:GNAT superfamily N-acetyltransferase